EDHVLGARDPHGARRLEDPLDLPQPVPLEGVVRREAARRIPLPLVHPRTSAALAGEAAVREVIGRIGEDQIDAGGRESGEEVQAVALDDPVEISLSGLFGEEGEEVEMALHPLTIRIWIAYFKRSPVEKSQ